MKYRPEIDGLRAIAVVPVIFFHAGLSIFSGGFIGVDVFFVISGFLITSILVNDINKQQFSIMRFYERRIRRILPVLFVVCFATILPSYALMSREQFSDYAISLGSVVLFVSNVVFWLQSGYFEGAANLKPLLHTWSLSVEEQYYVFYPVLLFAIFKLKKSVLILTVISIASLAFSEYGWRYSSQANFFLIFSRAWELLLGGLGAILAPQLLRIAGPTHDKLRTYVPPISLAIVAISMFLFTEQTPHPSLYTLAPCLGTLGLLVFCSSDSPIGKLLGFRPIVWIGLLSYSLYLWHQPVFAFLHLAGQDLEASYILIGALLATLVLSVASYTLIETPFRKRRSGLFSKRGVYTLSALGAVGLLLVSVVGSSGSLNPAVFSDKGAKFLKVYNGRDLVIDQYLNECNFFNYFEIDPSCLENPDTAQDTVLIWGDSHAQSIAVGLRARYGADYFFAQLATSACLPDIVQEDPDTVPRYMLRNRAGRDTACRKANALAWQYLSNHHVDTVVLAVNMDHETVKWQGVVDFLETVGVRRVILVGPLPRWGPTLPEAYASQISKVIQTGILSSQDPRPLELAQYMRDLPLHSETIELVSVDTIAFLCDQYDGACLYQIPGAPFEDSLMAFDDSHLSLSGSLYLADELFSELFPKTD